MDTCSTSPSIMKKIAALFLAIALASLAAAALPPAPTAQAAASDEVIFATTSSSYYIEHYPETYVLGSEELRSSSYGVYLHARDSSAIVYYTTDGSDPTTSSDYVTSGGRAAYVGSSNPVVVVKAAVDNGDGTLGAVYTGKFGYIEAPMTVTAVNYEDTYDGQVHKGGASPSVTEGTTIQYSTDGGQTWTNEVPSVTNVEDSLTYTVKATNPNYDDATAEGTLTVKPAPVTVTAKDVTKTYDGQAAAIDPEGVTINGLVNGESQDVIDYDLSFAEGVDKKNAGVTADAIDVSGKTDQGNYTVTFVDGTLTINPIQLTITANPQTYTYNGDVQGEGDTVYDDSDSIAEKFTVTGLQGGDTVANVTLDGQGLDAGTYDLTPSEAAINTGKQENYTITCNNGTLTINPATVTVTTQSASKTYDGTALTAPGTISALVGGDAVTFTVTGSQTEVGSSSNTYTIDWGDVNQKNYKVEENLGTLTVNAAKATLTFDLGSGTLDGKTGTITIEANVGDKINLPGAPTKDGYTFKFWKGSEYAAGAEYTVPEGGHEFTAEWEKNAVPATGDDAGMVAIPVSIVAGISLVVLIGSAARRRAA